MGNTIVPLNRVNIFRALDRIARRFDLADRIANPQLVLESLLLDVGVATRG